MTTSGLRQNSDAHWRRHVLWMTHYTSHTEHPDVIIVLLLIFYLYTQVYLILIYFKNITQILIHQILLILYIFSNVY